MPEQTYKLTAPTGVKVEVQGAARRDALLARGYTEGHGSKKSSSSSSDKK